MQMLLLGKRSAEERVAEFLVGLSRRLFARQGSLNQVRLSMSRLDIGNYLGLSEETVCRIFSRFQKDGLIRIDRKEVTLHDVSRLGALARLDQAA
jgi:CRP/FNR family transcriptional regulator